VAAIFFANDEDEDRAQEEWYEYQFRIEAIDKSELKFIVPGTATFICRHCGHEKRSGDGNPVFGV
jgi:hypothetical protein